MNNTVVSIFLILLVNRTLVCNGLCEVANELQTFLEGAIVKFIPVKYHTFGCFNTVFRSDDSTCNLKTRFLPMESPGCQNARNPKLSTRYDNINFINDKKFENFIYQDDIDADEICSHLRDFNKMPKAEKTKEKYAELYKSDAELALYSIVKHVYNPCYLQGLGRLSYIGRCILDMNKEALKFFRKLPPLESPMNKCQN